MERKVRGRRTAAGILLISVKPCKSQEVGTKVYKAKPVYPRAELARLYGRKPKPCVDASVDAGEERESF